jgi:hypothetical protein
MIMSLLKRFLDDDVDDSVTARRLPYRRYTVRPPTVDRFSLACLTSM